MEMSRDLICWHPYQFVHQSPFQSLKSPKPSLGLSGNKSG